MNRYVGVAKKPRPKLTTLWMGGLKLGGVLEEGVPNREGGGCFGYGDGARDDAGIMAAVDRELGIFHGVHVHGLLLAAN